MRTLESQKELHEFCDRVRAIIECLIILLDAPYVYRIPYAVRDAVIDTRMLNLTPRLCVNASYSPLLQTLQAQCQSYRQASSALVFVTLAFTKQCMIEPGANLGGTDG